MSQGWVHIFSTEFVTGYVHHGVEADVRVRGVGVEVRHYVAYSISIIERECPESKLLSTLRRQVIGDRQVGFGVSRKLGLNGRGSFAKWVTS